MVTDTSEYQGRIFCPLCGNMMRQNDTYFICAGNADHKIHVEKEWPRYKSGEKDRLWLKARMKVRLGKILSTRS